MTDLARVLFVDDEKFVLDALKRTLRNKVQMEVAEGGVAALEVLRSTTTPFQVVCTDMRMPTVDGLGVLKAFREESPDTTRILLTGQADMDAAIAAVNVGSVFRFLTKPVDPALLETAIADAAELNRLRTAERDVLERTLRGSVQALLETLSLANPTMFARAQRLKTYTTSFLDALNVENRWEIEIAVMLSQIGAVTLPPDVSARLSAGVELSADDEEMVATMPETAVRLLADIPRLETIRNVIKSQASWRATDTPLASKLLSLAVRVDALASRGESVAVIEARVTADAAAYGDEVMFAFKHWVSSSGSKEVVQTIPATALTIGMRLAADVHTSDGLLLVGRGQEVTESLITRIRNFSQSVGLAEPTVLISASK